MKDNEVNLILTVNRFNILYRQTQTKFLIFKSTKIEITMF